MGRRKIMTSYEAGKKAQEEINKEFRKLQKQLAKLESKRRLLETKFQAKKKDIRSKYGV